MIVDKSTTDDIKIRNNLEKREQEILIRIKNHYGQKLCKIISDEEAQEIAKNLLDFIKVIYGA